MVSRGRATSISLGLCVGRGVRGGGRHTGSIAPNCRAGRLFQDGLVYLEGMRVLLQRVDRASVTVGEEVVGEVGLGLLALTGVAAADTEDDAAALASKVAGLRIFADAEGRFNLSVRDVGGSALVVSQFTLMSDVRRGRRPSFTAAAPPGQAARLVEEFAARLEAEGVPTAAGRFGAMMLVDLRNNGPFTLLVETRNGKVV